MGISSGIFLSEVVDMDFMTTKEAAKLWGITRRRVQVLCDSGQVEGATKFGDIWAIPKGVQKPIDGRTKSAKEQKQQL